jgi:predicted histidine transporter YuiF (NhaC family)
MLLLSGYDVIGDPVLVHYVFCLCVCIICLCFIQNLVFVCIAIIFVIIPKIIRDLPWLKMKYNWDYMSHRLTGGLK